MRLHVGTSGFSYDEWRGPFYPPELASDAMLSFYAARLPAVELNNTFYRMPKKATVATWAAAVPDGFRFAVKASQRITWTQKLKDCGELLGLLFDATSALGDKLGCIFYQLPKWVRKDTVLLQEFLAQQRPGVKVAFEFAHASWLDDDAVALLRQHDAAVVLSDKDGAETPQLVDTGSWGYLRLRRAEYSDDDLRAWRQRVEQRGWSEAFVFMKHEDSCAGPALAQRLLGLATA
ncbi:MAG TPA: DUF72 domain-containing protein [Planctomycetota bacterium]|nr:DUF72 domain-containing protein [Planctomycetota bacterium]